MGSDTYDLDILGRLEDELFITTVYTEVSVMLSLCRRCGECYGLRVQLKRGITK
jgi:hypothetical protein